MHKPETRTIFPAKSLQGEFVVPGDKSISHRAIMFAAIHEDDLNGERMMALYREKSYSELNDYLDAWFFLESK